MVEARAVTQASALADLLAERVGVLAVDVGVVAPPDVQSSVQGPFVSEGQGVSVGLVSGRLHLTGVVLEAGARVSGVTFLPRTASSGVRHQWACVVSPSDRAVVARTSDYVGADVRGGLERMLLFPEPFVLPAPLLAWVGLVVVADSMPVVAAVPGSVIGDTPLLDGPDSLGGVVAVRSAPDDAPYVRVVYA